MVVCLLVRPFFCCSCWFLWGEWEDSGVYPDLYLCVSVYSDLIYLKLILFIWFKFGFIDINFSALLYHFPLFFCFFFSFFFLSYPFISQNHVNVNEIYLYSFISFISLIGLDIPRYILSLIHLRLFYFPFIFKIALFYHWLSFVFRFLSFISQSSLSIVYFNRMSSLSYICLLFSL